MKTENHPQSPQIVFIKWKPLPLWWFPHRSSARSVRRVLWSPVSPEGKRNGGVKILGPVVHYWDCHEKIRDHSKTNNRRASTCQSCHLFEVNAAAAISIIKSKSPGQFLVVGPLPADTNCQQPFPDKVILSVSEEKFRDLKLILPFLLVSNALKTSSCIFSVCLCHKLHFRKMMRGYYPISPKRVSEYSFR